MFYRLYDKQTGRYMGTGYNTTSEVELTNAYIGYKSIDWEKETEEYYRSLSIFEQLRLIEDDEFIIEKSNTKFEEYE